MVKKYIVPFNRLSRKDVALVGGKTASLGEMISKTSVPVPNGFAITAEAYRYFIEKAGITKRIKKILKHTNVKNIKSLQQSGHDIRELIKNAELPKDLERQIMTAYQKLNCRYVAVRSSATAEDLPDASFAGEQESYLNVEQHQLMKRVKDCFASLFTDRAISYREDKKFDHFKVYLSVAIQKLIYSKASGVMFTLDPDSGHRNFIYINGSYGLGDYIVQGRVNPDDFIVLKPTMTIIQKKLGKKDAMEVRSARGVHGKAVPKAMRERFVLTDKEILTLARYGMMIEKHYGHAMDIEWAKDEKQIYIIQARPETVHSSKKKNIYQEYKLLGKGKVIAQGTAIGRKIGAGAVNVIRNVKDIGKFKQGEVLVTVMTDPDWEPIMKIASAIVTEVGGKTSHAAIVSRELGVPCVVGAIGATTKLKAGKKVTVDCTEEDGKVLDGMIKFNVAQHEVSNIPKTMTQLFVNLGEPEQAFDVSQLPVDGVGLAREEFIIATHIGEHPLAMIKQKREQIYINKLAEGIAKIGAAFYPRPVIVRLSDFKTNEYGNLKGGAGYEPPEDNPMIGWRGASRYVDKKFEPAFRLECRAFKKVRDVMKLTNVKIMVPFCRTLEEADGVIKILKSEGLVRGRNGLQLYVMAEIPSNIILVKEFSKRFDGFSIGSNDLTQLTLGIDRDNRMLVKEFDERNAAVKISIERLIKGAHAMHRKVGICGDAPSTYPEYAKFLVKCGIDSISVTPDVAIQTKMNIAKVEKSRK